MIWYIENPKYATRKLLELHKISKVARHKINTQKSLAFLNTNNERSERKIKEAIPFFIISKRIKYLGINLPMEANALYTEHKTLMKETKDDTNRNIYHVPRLVESVLSKDYTTKGKLQIQSNVYEITNAIF